MGMLDDMLAQVGGLDIASLAGKVGLTPEQVESAMGALGQAHAEPTDTATGAAAKTGLPVDQIQQLLHAIGGENGLSSIVGGMSQGGGISSVLSGLFGKA